MDVGSEVFCTYAFWAGVLITKVMAMSLLTSRQRFAKKVFASPEDVAGNPKAKIDFGDPDVERVRRAHLNDLENIVPFLIVALLYILTNPSAGVATLLFKIYGISRIAHTIVYAIYPTPQPARAIAFMVGLIIQLYMSFKVISYFY